MCRRVFFFIAVVLFTSGCAGARSPIPTPFPTSEPTGTIVPSGPVVLSVTELLNAPGLYLDTVVQLTGRLRKAPLVICDSDYYPSPASWGLGEEGLLAAAGGFDDQVRTLLPKDLTMTVEGRWRRWEGMVGCGKQAQRQEVWYLDVNRILSPNPLSLITLTPPSGIEISAVTTEATLPAAGGDDEGEVIEPLLPEATPVLTEPTRLPEDYPGLPGVESSPIIPPFETPTIDTAPYPGQAEATVPPSGTGTPQASEGPGGIVDKGSIDDAISDNLVISSLAAGTTDSWRYQVQQGDEGLYLYAIAPPPADIILSIYKDGQAIINNQNIAPAGSPETLHAPQLRGPGTYEIRIATSGETATAYGLTIYNDPILPVTIGGMIAPGSPRNSVPLPAGATQFWFFTANAGDVVAIRLKPKGEQDAAADLYDPNADYIVSIDNTDEGIEEYREVKLSTSGLHAIRVFEYYGLQPMTYDLEINFR